MQRRRAAKVVAAGVASVVLLALLAGCGSGTNYPNDPRPPALITVSAAVNDGHVVVSPNRFGAGPVNVVVANETTNSQLVTLESATFNEKTGPINPSDTASFEANLGSGRYRLTTSDPSIAPATILVGPSRPSAQNQLLQP
jgi:hypothetical protein